MKSEDKDIPIFYSPMFLVSKNYLDCRVVGGNYTRKDDGEGFVFEQ